MVGFLAALLSSKPEQEQNLLRLLVDKLGDSDKTVSSRTSYHLLQLLQAHPMMKTIIVREVASIVLKPANAPVQVTGQKIRFSAPAPVSHSASLRSTDHSKYYGIITLNQIMLTRTPQDKQVANRLIEIYFDIFKDLLGTHGDSADDVATTKDPELKDRKRRRDEKRGKFAKGSAKDVSRKERRQQEKSQQALEAESKMMAAVLTGVNRAFPYSEIDGDV
jgi:ribosome biogenesis protein MAK21